MSSQTFSFLVWCWRKKQTGTTQLRVMSVDTAQELPLSDSCLLLRITVDEETLVERCLIRHLNSGRETYIQGGSGLRTFVQTCLVLSKPDR
jgi:hypothetical protein